MLTISSVKHSNNDPVVAAYSPYRSGYCDGLFGRECKSPWADAGFKFIWHNTRYISGYMDGEKRRAELMKRPHMRDWLNQFE